MASTWCAGRVAAGLYCTTRRSRIPWYAAPRIRFSAAGFSNRVPGSTMLSPTVSRCLEYSRPRGRYLPTSDAMHARARLSPTASRVPRHTNSSTTGAASWSGSAQARRAGALLQHGSVLLESPRAADYLRGGGAPTLGGVGVRELLGREVSRAELVTALAAGFSAALQRFADSDPPVPPWDHLHHPCDNPGRGEHPRRDRQRDRVGNGAVTVT